MKRKIDYKKYSPEIQDFMNGVEAHLIKRYGSIDPSWNITLTMLADTLKTYYDCQKSIEEHGVYNEEKKLKHPLLSTVKDAVATITKITTSLGISPWSQSKIKQVDGDDTEDFIDNLVNV